MTKRKNFTDRFIERIDALDGNSLQAYLLRLSKDKGFFATILDSVDEGILVVDRYLHIRYHNRTAKELLGLPADLSKVRLAQFIHNVDWRMIIQQDVDEWTRLSREEIELFYPEHRFLQMYLVPQEVDKESCALVILRDITAERKRSRKELEDSTAKAVSLLAAGVAHEIGNPLNSLYLNLQIVEQDLQDFATSDLADAADMVMACRQEVERLDNIIHQFLHAIRPGSSPFDLVDVRVIIKETLHFMSQEFELRQVNIQLTGAEALPQVLGNSAQLKQAFYNILKNSVQAISDTGEIVIDCSYDDHYISVIFADNGCGVTPEQLNEMFDPFKSFKVGGSGLGMMIIQRIFNEHNALCSINSSPGEGFQFAVKFPRQDGLNRAAQLPDNSQQEGGE